MADYTDLTYAMAGLGSRRNPFDARRRQALGMYQAGTSSEPVQHPLQAASRLAQALAGGWMAGQVNRDEEAALQKEREAYSSAAGIADPQERIKALTAINPRLGAQLAGQLAIEQAKIGQQQQALQKGAEGFGSSYGAPQGGAPQGGPGAGIAAVESGGNYQAIGPVANEQGNRAYGKYQVLDTNIGPWTQEVLGRPMTPQEFLASPQAQEAVFRAKFGQYVQKYGEEGAVRAWFAGEGGMNNPNASDVNGMTVAGYSNRVMGGAQRVGQPQPVPQRAGMPPQATAQGVSGPAVVAPPAVPNVPRPAPTQQQIQQYQQRLRSGEFGIGPDAVSKARAALESELNQQWQVERERSRMQFEQQRRQTERVQNRADARQEFDYQQAHKAPTEGQSLSGGFADRMRNSAVIIDRFAMAGTSKGDRMLDATVWGVGIPFANAMQSDEYQQFKQAKDDFINAQLRRESGAVISDEEYERADRQYFPIPGDRPEVIAQKERNRQLAVQGMIRNAGPGYQPSPLINAPMPDAPGAASAPAVGTVQDGYRFKGGDPSKQDSWEPVQ